MRMRLSSSAKSKLLLLLAGVVALPCAARVQEKSDPDYEREELGVNSCTTPSIARIFQQLDELKPLPFDELKREPGRCDTCQPRTTGPGVWRIDSGRIPDCCRRKERLVDDLGRSLLKEAKSLA